MTGPRQNRDFVGARVVDPSIGLDGIRTVVVRQGTIAALIDGPPAVADPDVDRVDCAGMVLCPGFIDPHVHLREPGDSHKETLASGLAAAAAGGFTAVAAMPNTRPSLDSAQAIANLIHTAAQAGGVRCYPIGAVTLGRKGEAMAALRMMAAAGAVAFSDDGAATKSLKTLYHAAKLIADLPHAFLSHCDDPSFDGALMNEGFVSDLLGVQGSPNLAEAAAAARDLLVAKATGKRWHLCHVSARETLDVLRWAQASGIRATGEATPHHLRCTDELMRGYDARMRVNPPLRSSDDVAALRAGVADGTISVFASDHAPHAGDEKEPPLSQACVGFTGLETAVAAVFDALENLPIAKLVENFSTNPAALLGVAGGTLAPGAQADITGLYLERRWTVDPSQFKSKGHVTPFAGQTFTVRPALTVVDGNIVYALPNSVDHEGRSVDHKGRSVDHKGRPLHVRVTGT